MSLRKPRADAVLRNLPEPVHADLVHGLVVEAWGYEEARDWLAKTHAVKTSVGALTAFWYTDCVRHKLTRARTAADAVRDALSSSRPDFDEAALGALSQKVFELAAAPGVDAGELQKLVSALNDTRRVTLKVEEVALARRRVALLEDKAAEAKRKLGEAVAKAGKGGLSQESLKLIEEAAGLL